TWSNLWKASGASPSKHHFKRDRYTSLDINIVHPIRVTQLVIPHFLKEGGSSGTSDLAPISTPPQLQTLGIRVVAVVPGLVNMPIWTEAPEKLRMISDLNQLVDSSDLAMRTVDLTENNWVHSCIPSGGELLPVKGGTILKISKGKRSIVKQLMDEGEEYEPNKIEVNKREVWGLLASGKWGVNGQQRGSRL
ncbi:hypothetical protein N7455_003892, partial [Penicillium solitum]|uniref:uncharacterized protein n=1 Tax=Penicillium solitum TaxID=60172 RepID=UPI0032C45868